MGLYIGLHPKYGMVIWSEGIWTIEYATGPFQVFHGEEAQMYHDQYGCIPRHGEGGQMVYQHLYPFLTHQDVIIPNNQGTGSRQHVTLKSQLPMFKFYLSPI